MHEDQEKVLIIRRASSHEVTCKSYINNLALNLFMMSSSYKIDNDAYGLLFHKKTVRAVYKLQKLFPDNTSYL